MHYDNPYGDVGSTDSSGLRIYYTKTIREHAYGTLPIGGFIRGTGGWKVGDNKIVEHSFSCPGSVSMALAVKQ